MAASTEPLKELEVGPYSEVAGRPNPEHLELQFIPSLGAILTSVEDKLGKPLTQAQVELLRDKASVIVARPEMVRDAEKHRGYKDIDPQHAWQNWQAVRAQP